MSGRKHDRQHFFKYTTFDTAMRVIETLGFRWSSPEKFNDPFDHQSGFSLSIDPEEFSEILVGSILRIIFADEEPVFKSPTFFSALVWRLRQFRDRMNRSEIESELREVSAQVSGNLHDHILQLNKAIQGHYCHSRVFCVSERRDNVVMWSHYAESHRGVVFKLRCIDEIDNTLLAARKVEYVTRFIDFVSPAEYVRHLTGEEPVDLSRLCWNLPFIKHADWAYEQEWRVYWALIDEPAGDGYSICSENPLVFDEIYLGCRMGDEEKMSLVSLVKQKLPHVRIFNAEMSRTEFALAFVEKELTFP